MAFKKKRKDSFKEKKWRGYKLRNGRDFDPWKDIKSYRLMSDEELLGEFGKIDSLSIHNEILEELATRGLKPHIRQLLEKGMYVYGSETKMKIIRLLNTYSKEELAKSSKKIIRWLKTNLANRGTTYISPLSSWETADVLKLLVKLDNELLIENKETVEEILRSNKVTVSDIGDSENALSNLIELANILKVSFADFIKDKEDLLIASTISNEIDEKLKNELINDEEVVADAVEKLVELSSNPERNEAVKLLNEIAERYRFQKVNLKDEERTAEESEEERGKEEEDLSIYKIIALNLKSIELNGNHLTFYLDGGRKAIGELDSQISMYVEDVVSEEEIEKILEDMGGLITNKEEMVDKVKRVKVNYDVGTALTFLREERSDMKEEIDVILSKIGVFPADEARLERMKRQLVELTARSVINDQRNSGGSPFTNPF